MVDSFVDCSREAVVLKWRFGLVSGMNLEYNVRTCKARMYTLKNLKYRPYIVDINSLSIPFFKAGRR
jgi:hypothetical protein